MNNIEIINTSQELFDSFNTFILSDDTKVFNKLIARTIIYNQVKDIPGDIVECGVFKGTGIYTFLKLKRIFNPNSNKKVIGFDFFDNKNLITTLDNDINEFELIKGDVSKTTLSFSKENPGFKISLLYLDLDLEIPTYDTLSNFWDNMTKGGIIVLDEYGYHKWSESKGVDRFINEKGIEIKNLNFLCPTAYIQK